MSRVSLLAAALALAVPVLPATPAAAQDRIPSHCVAVAGGAPDLPVIRARFGTPVPDDSLRIHYVDHSMFALETPGGLTAVTDYNGRTGGDHVPDVVTMNNAHSTHWTALPDDRIPHVLEGWAIDGTPAGHHLDLGEMLVRNVPTDVRTFDGVREAGNSVFLFEAAGLCIAHLGHLHHEPTDLQYALIGRVDVLMVPVDGGMTLDLPTMSRVVSRMRSSVVLPMHWFGGASLERFLGLMGQEFRIDRRTEPHIEVSLDTLPDAPTIVVLPPRRLD